MASQPISYCYDHRLGLELADSADAEDVLEVDVLFGSDHSWSLVTGGVRREQLSRLWLDGFCLDQLDDMRLQ